MAADWRQDQHSAARQEPCEERYESGSPTRARSPFRWGPYSAPDWQLTDGDRKAVSRADFKGRPVLLIFYLGSSCPHCVEQLGLLEAEGKQFQALGINIIAINSENVAGPTKPR